MKTIENNKPVSFVFYPSFKKSLSYLDDKDRLTMYDAITDYGLSNIEPNFENKMLFAIWEQFKIGIDAAKNKYEKRKAAGSAGGKAKAEKLNSNQSETKIKQSYQPEPKVSVIEEKEVEIPTSTEDTSIKTVSDFVKELSSTNEVLFSYAIEYAIDDILGNDIDKDIADKIKEKFPLNEKITKTVLQSRVEDLLKLYLVDSK